MEAEHHAIFNLTFSVLKLFLDGVETHGGCGVLAVFVGAVEKHE